MTSFSVADPQSRLRSRQRPTLNQLPEPGKTNSKFSVPQVTWPASHNISAGQSDSAVGIEDSNITKVALSLRDKLAAPVAHPSPQDNRAPA